MLKAIYHQLARHRCILRLPAILLLLLGFVTAAPGDDYSYNTNIGTVTITRYMGPGGDVTVPDMIEGLPVTGIGDAAFGFSYNVTKLTLPTSVTNIGQLAFLSCIGLTNVFISAGAIGIGELAFKNCVNLSAITVATNNAAFSSLGGILFDKDQAALRQYPEGKAGSSFVIPGTVRTIGDGAFFSCTGLTNVLMPAGLLSIGDAAFYGCTNLSASSIPDGLTNVGEQAFLRCGGLSSVVIPDSVLSLGSQAFFACTGLTNVAVGNGVTSIGDSSFTGCSSLERVVVGSGVTRIGASAFESCIVLNDLWLGGSLTNIGAGAFRYCFDLPEVSLPGGLGSIGSQAFFYCSSLSSVNLPASMTDLGDRVFEFCGNLTAITVNPGNPAFQSIDGVLFDTRQKRLVDYPANHAGATYMVPDGTASIGDTAFVSAYSLTSVAIPASVTNIETLAFYDCAEVTGFFFEGNPPSVGLNVFDLDGAATVYYLPGTENWAPMFDGLPTASWNPQVESGPGSLAVGGNGFGFTIAGTPGIPVVVEAATNLGGPWIPLQSGVLTNGCFYFGDPQWTNYPGRFYRVRTP